MDTVMIVTGESSGELYGSLLAKELKDRWPDLRILGVGGEKMSKAGVELISRFSSAFGLIEAFTAFKEVKATFRKTVDAIKKWRPAVVVLIDYPDFNIKVAKMAKSLGIKILYYVSPQVWAWRKGRVKKIASLVDRMAVILPFEEEIYRKAGVACEFVGHPIVDEIKACDINFTSTEEYRVSLGLDPKRPIISLLPGSRPHELKRLLPLMVDVVREFRNDPEIDSGKHYQFCVPFTLNVDDRQYSPYLEALRQEGVVIKKGESVRVLAASEMAVIASGTATLQAAFLEVPMVVIYKLSPLTYLLGRLIVDVKHISLVNLLSGKTVVPELLQNRANPRDIVKELKRIMFDTLYKESMLNHCRLIKEHFWDKSASRRVAEIVAEIAKWETLSPKYVSTL